MTTRLSVIFLAVFLLVVSCELYFTSAGYLKTDPDSKGISKGNFSSLENSATPEGTHTSVTAVQSEPQKKDTSEEDYTGWMNIKDGFRYCYCQKDSNATTESPYGRLPKLCFCETFFLYNSINSEGFYVPFPLDIKVPPKDIPIPDKQKEKYRKKLECFQNGFHWLDCILKHPDESTEKTL